MKFRFHEVLLIISIENYTLVKLSQMCQKGKIKKFYWINTFSHENLILLRYTAMHGTRKLGFKLCSWVNTVNKYLWENHDLHIQILWVSLSNASAFYQLPWCRFGVFIVNFEHISHLCSSVSIVNFEHVIASWFVSKKTMQWILCPWV